MNRPENDDRPADAALAEPWQAEALALSLALQEAGLFSAAEWSETLGAEIEKARVAGDPCDGSTYYRHVTAALERLSEEKGLLSSDLLAKRKSDWETAYRNTPHGQPVRLDPASE